MFMVPCILINMQSDDKPSKTKDASRWLLTNTILSNIVYNYNSFALVQYIWIKYTDDYKTKDSKNIKTLFYVFSSQICSYIWLYKSGFHYAFKYLWDIINHSYCNPGVSTTEYTVLVHASSAARMILRSNFNH